MTAALLDVAQVARAAAGVSLRIPRGPHRGKTGEARSASVGSSMELHDFRHYHPGDDLRHVDWNAVARTGELVLRVRQDEVSPRIEVLLDASASMAVSPEKASRARELALWACIVSARAGLEPVLFCAGATGHRVDAASARGLLGRLELDGRDGLDVAMKRLPPLRPCGLRVVISDFLFEGSPQPVVERLVRGAAGLALLQVLDPEDLEPSGGEGARLTDSESSDTLERLLTKPVLETYRTRFDAHVAMWAAAARRCHATWVQLPASSTLPALVRSKLSELVEVS